MSLRALGRSGIAAALLFLAACGDDTTSPAKAPLFRTMVVFGASLDDVGNACNLSPASCPPPPYAVNRVSNGPLWVEHVASKYGAYLAPSRLGGTNYAYNGARTGPIAGATQGVPNMVEQVDAYLASGATAGRDRALFVVNAATVGNDINVALSRAVTDPSAPATIITGAVNNVVNMVSKLYQGGARHVLVVNSTDIGRTPLVRAAGPVASVTATALSQQFNAGLAAALPGLRSANAGLNLYLLDLWQLTADVLGNPAAYGFTITTTPCLVTAPTPSLCSTPDTFFFWDSFHPTAATGRLVAVRAIAALPSF